MDDLVGRHFSKDEKNRLIVVDCESWKHSMHEFIKGKKTLATKRGTKYSGKGFLDCKTKCV